MITFVTTSGGGANGTGGILYGVNAANTFIGPTVNVTLAAGQRAHMVVEKSLGSSVAGGASGLNIYPCYQLSGGGVLTTQGGGIFGLQVVNTQRIPFGINWVFSGLAAGTYTIGMCGASAAGSANWNNNEWGYISALVF